MGWWGGTVVGWQPIFVGAIADSKVVGGEGKREHSERKRERKKKNGRREEEEKEREEKKRKEKI